MTSCTVNLPVIKRKKAIELGLKTYFTGKLCKNGRLCERYTIVGKCIECKKDFYYRNQSKILSNAKKYREANKPAIKQTWRKWYPKNADRHKANNKRYAQENQETIVIYRKNYRKKNSLKVLERKTQWRRANPEHVRIKGNEYSNNRCARKMAAEGFFTSEDIERIRFSQKNKCAACRKPLKKHHIDHIISLCQGGTNWPRNLQLLCPPCNLSKHAKDPIDFMRERGFLL